jgi:hypothetical protein
MKSLVDERERPAISEAHHFIHSNASARHREENNPRCATVIYLDVPEVGTWRCGDALSSVDAFWVNFVNVP